MTNVDVSALFESSGGALLAKAYTTIGRIAPRSARTFELPVPAGTEYRAGSLRAARREGLRYDWTVKRRQRLLVEGEVRNDTFLAVRNAEVSVRVQDADGNDVASGVAFLDVVHPRSHRSFRIPIATASGHRVKSVDLTVFPVEWRTDSGENPRPIPLEWHLSGTGEGRRITGTVENRDEDHVRTVAVTVEFEDARGSSIGTDYAVVDDLKPVGVEPTVEGSFTVECREEDRIRSVTAVQRRAADSGIGEQCVHSWRLTSGGRRVSGEVRNLLDRSLENVEVTARFVDREGTFLGARQTVVETVDANATATFSLDCPSVPEFRVKTVTVIPRRRFVLRSEPTLETAHGTATATCTLENIWTGPLIYAEVTFVFYDRHGTELGRVLGPLEDVEPGSVRTMTATLRSDDAQRAVALDYRNKRAWKRLER